jgi:secondary thiamine-phosphate synthase enzyme
MTVHTGRFTVETRGENDMHDITGEVGRIVQESGCQNGVVNVFVRHTTAAIMIGEYEPGLVHDIPVPLERIAPPDRDYRHNQLNHDDNAHSHLVGSIMGPSETVPFTDGRPVLGTWQQVILLELDTHPRRREVVVQVIGE